MTAARPTADARRHAADADRYLRRHAGASPSGLAAPDPALDLVVVVPAFAEPDPGATIASVCASGAPVATEMLVVVNAPDDADRRTARAAAACLTRARAAAARLQTRARPVHVLDCRALPARHAGVGLARKIGMDAALARLAASRSGRGAIVSLDADCRVAPDYLAAIAAYFDRHPDAVAATIAFEHPLDTTPPELRRAIVDYELHLRSYRQGLAAAGSPYARHAIGSALAVRSEIYAQEGGMNRRKAGEDFYFLNKLLKRGDVGEIRDTTVYPAARRSDRVPFGTGAALSRTDGRTATSYAPDVYRHLQQLIDSLESAVPAGGDADVASRPFLQANGFDTWLARTRANVAGEAALRRHLHRWLDGLRTLKFVHWLSATGDLPRVPAGDAARRILGWRGIDAPDDPVDLLQRFRQLDRAAPPGRVDLDGA